MSRSEPTKAEWLRRAIRHCEFWGMSCPASASSRAHTTRVNAGLRPRLTTVWLRARFGPYDAEDVAAPWLPSNMRVVNIEDLRARLVYIESEAT